MTEDGWKNKEEKKSPKRYKIEKDLLNLWKNDRTCIFNMFLICIKDEYEGIEVVKYSYITEKAAKFAIEFVNILL